MTQKNQTRAGKARVGCDMLGRPSHLDAISKATLCHLLPPSAGGCTAPATRVTTCAREGASRTLWNLPSHAPWGAKAGEAMSLPALAVATQHPPANAAFERTGVVHPLRLGGEVRHV